MATGSQFVFLKHVIEYEFSFLYSESWFGHPEVLQKTCFVKLSAKFAV